MSSDDTTADTTADALRILELRILELEASLGAERTIAARATSGWTAALEDNERLRKITRAHAKTEGQLHLRIAQLETELATRKRQHDEDAETLREIELVCEAHGYEPDSGQCVSDWIAQQMAALAAEIVADVERALRGAP
jgi:hypothetical protein